MIEPEHLHHFITEELYFIKDSEKETLPKVAKVFSEVVILSAALSSKDSELLNKLMGAIELPKSKATILQKLSSSIDYRVLLCFGLPTEHSVFQKHEYFIPIVSEGKTFLLSTPIATLHDTIADKRKLWDALKQIFK